MKIPYDFGEAFDSWVRIPIDDFEYLSGWEILNLHRKQFVELIEMAHTIRKSQSNWRNLNGKMSRLMFPPDRNWDKKSVVDFGCGLGLDALSFTERGGIVTLVDIHPVNLMVANQTLCTRKCIADRLAICSPTWPYFQLENPIDLFWSFGVLHHFPYGMDVLRRVCGMLSPEGECRIGLYSDQRWVQMIGEPVPEGPTWQHPKFNEFVGKCDAVGTWADWYSPAKLENEIKDFATITSCDYLCNDQFIGAVIKPKV